MRSKYDAICEQETKEDTKIIENYKAFPERYYRLALIIICVIVATL